MGSDEEVHRTDGRPTGFQLLPDASVQASLMDHVEIEDLERHEDLPHRRGLAFRVPAVPDAVFEFRHGDGRKSDPMACRLGRPASFQDPLRKGHAPALLLVPGPDQLQASDEEDQRIGVQQTDHRRLTRDSKGGCNRRSMNPSGSSRHPSTNISQGSRSITRNPSAVFLRCTSRPPTRNSKGSRMAWLRPCMNTFATIMHGIHRPVSPSTSRTGRAALSQTREDANPPTDVGCPGPRMAMPLRGRTPLPSRVA